MNTIAWMISFSEWDIGMSNRVFYYRESLIDKIDISGTDYDTVQEAIDDGMIEIIQIEIED